MKALLTLAAALLITAATAQTTAEKYQYCMIVGKQKILSTKVIIEVDYGQKQGIWGVPTHRDDDGKVQSFNSMMDALNYMGEQGWEFVQAIMLGEGGNYVYRFIMRRKVDEKK
jgi:hypothetical protein